MELEPCVLGIDAGSVTVSIALINDKGSLISSAAMAHQGDVSGTFRHLLAGLNLSKLPAVAVTIDTPAAIGRHMAYDDQVAVIRAARHRHGLPGSILHVGGERFHLSLFDADGRYAGSRANTACAAGTGSFLDQQSVRLGLDGPEALSRAARVNKGKVPDIATRCAVFAKTDLIHAQQQGFSVEQICDGLCRGLARNIFNTVFTEKEIRTPIVFCGGVSRNPTVQAYLEELTGESLVTDPDGHLYGALGAALCLLDEIKAGKVSLPQDRPNDFFSADIRTAATLTPSQHLYPPLEVTLSDYPSFEDARHFIEQGVEVDIYEADTGQTPCGGYLGLDVGSTSTKGVLMTDAGQVLAGFYTRTASRPVQAVQAILRAMDRFSQDRGQDIAILGCGTTGSGRKLSAAILGADLVLDEITAHSRAAYELNPEVDIIIEIGGQDAKFTTMKNGVVTSSFMNTVCAAGTGSFIEEQALKLGCPLEDYSPRTLGVQAPASSDRCTVFMERDMNHLLSEGYSVNAVLASALHSVRDNYMSKVATESRIGRTILFQGATAKNRSLVAAFEQRLNRPIHVSRFCHLTGALGVALTLKDQNCRDTRFRGIDLWRRRLPVRQETCRLCTNHCKLTLVDVDHDTVAFGFLCGRDYNTHHYVPPKHHFHLVKSRKKGITRPHPSPVTRAVTIGLPAGLHMAADLSFWQIFFNYLGFKTVTSTDIQHPIARGRTLSTAEFCTPMTALHAHTAHLLETADVVFLPYYFENRSREKHTRRQYCYYTQYAPAVISAVPGLDRSRILSPVVKYLHSGLHTKRALYQALKQIPGVSLSFLETAAAHEKALEWQKGAQQELFGMMTRCRNRSQDIDVLLLGRPYTILSRQLNAGIPDIFAGMGINAFYQDMMDPDARDVSAIAPLLEEIHWEHAATILKAALAAARTPNLYPVYITSFKCTPDAFALDYFKTIMEAHHKPYLILELDEHDSSVGYETRIEAAVRAFRNHADPPGEPGSKPVTALSRVNPALAGHMRDKTVIMPNWDPLTGRLLVSVMKREGYPALLMEETDHTIRQGLQTNSGQCLPLNAIATAFAHTLKQHHLDPSRAVLWMSRSDIACNIKLYPHHIKVLLERMGNGMEKAAVYKGDLSLNDISRRAAVNTWFAYMFGGLVRSLGCRLRPYETRQGLTDQAIQDTMDLLSRSFEGEIPREKALTRMAELFRQIPVHRTPRPKVSIFGDFYVRDNPVMNQDLIHFIEDQGGEVVTTPYYRFVKMIASPYFRKWFREGKYMNLLSHKALFTAMTLMEKRYYRYFEPFFNAPEPVYDDPFEEILATYGLLPEHTGESMDNILKLHYTLKAHPDLALLVQTSPANCCPGLVTEAMAAVIEKKSGVPMVSITYDGLGRDANRVIIPFLKYAGSRQAPPVMKCSG